MIVPREFPVYVVHFRGAPERKAFMSKQLANAGFRNVVFAEKFDRRRLTDKLVARFYDASPDKWRDKLAAMRNILIENAQFHPSKKSWSQGVSYEGPAMPFRPLGPAEIAVTIEHFSIYEGMCAAGIDAALILEDDTVLADGFGRIFSHHLALTPDDWDFVFMGSGCGLRVPERAAGTFVYKMTPPRSKCADSYMIRRKAARQLLPAAIPFMMPIDWEIGYWMIKLGLTTYWWEPPSVVQGSQIGLYRSSISRPG